MAIFATTGIVQFLKFMKTAKRARKGPFFCYLEFMDSNSGGKRNNETSEIRKEGTGTRFTGTEPIFGGFTHTANILSNVRLIHYGQIFVQVSDLGGSIVSLARDYKSHGDAARAYQELIRIRAVYDKRVQQWRAEEFKRIQKKRTLNGNQIRDLEKELNLGYLEISKGDSTLNKLQNDLDLISRVGDSSPLLQPMKSTVTTEDTEYVPPVLNRKKKTSKALLSLAKFVKPDGLSLAFSDALYCDDFDDAIREHCYDQNTHLAFIAHWSDRNPSTRERGQIYLRLLLIPKSVDALADLPAIIEKHKFILHANNSPFELCWESLTLAFEKTLVEKNLKDYLCDVEATSFQHKDLIVKKPFEFFAADFCSNISFELVHATKFILTVSRKDNS